MSGASRISGPPVAPPAEVSPRPAQPGPVSVRASVDQEQTFDGKLQANVLHDVLVKAGAGLESSDVSVRLGSPRLVSSNLVASPDGKYVDREDEIEVKVVIKTKQRLALFVEALAGATVDSATLTLTPRDPAARAQVSAGPVEPSPGQTGTPGAGS